MDTALLLKVLVVGERGTGKTAFIQRYVHHSFKREYKATIGVGLFFFPLCHLSHSLWTHAQILRTNN